MDAGQNNVACTANNGCDQTFLCQGGVCVGSNPVSCPPLDACHGAGTCTATGPSTHSCSTGTAMSGTPCGSACVSLSGIANCGACGAACDTTTGTPTCNGSTCSYACEPGHTDCNSSVAPDTDGCECATPTCCGTGCQTAHSNGTGQTFYDCNALGTINQAQAQAACTAYTGSASACSPFTGVCGAFGQESSSSICGSVGGTCECWEYAGTEGARVTAVSGARYGFCAGATDPTWN